MNNKALVLDNMGKYDEALLMYDHVLSVRRDKLADNHTNTLTTMNNKASVLDNMGKYDKH
jgi:tetratricopeptide (TPR) repeat protein